MPSLTAAAMWSLNRRLDPSYLSISSRTVFAYVVSGVLDMDDHTIAGDIEVQLPLWGWKHVFHFYGMVIEGPGAVFPFDLVLISGSITFKLLARTTMTLDPSSLSHSSRATLLLSDWSAHPLPTEPVPTRSGSNSSICTPKSLWITVESFLRLQRLRKHT
ncbi:hypothetical protein SISSUDRAFT_516798 [Sistotremastrum suecicum HHB10207 ss-3]|uniref:Uncharacterized protein n=1 Tax=Sistotremastrum suecicum HHB10207 ss-3 TaxID=1314776 RepID=A0A166F8K8_9AGAM|nr:hypothetical protein SISSUDRAFT_516798 [Sistotremastrum suecicum HHB10207 ss-3]